MKTEDLVGLLARQSEPVAARYASVRFAVAMLGGVVMASILLVLLLGLNPALGQVAKAPMFWVKLGFASAAAVAGVLLALRLSRPGAALGALPATLAAPIALVWVLAAISLVGAPPDERPVLLLGETWRICAFNIAMLSLPVFVGLIWAMKGLAPTRLRLSGSSAGFGAGATGALVYALHCPELAAPFVAVWYVLGLLIPTIVGVLLGPWLLRW